MTVDLATHDPETGQYAPCPHCRGSYGRSGWHQRKGPAPLLRARHDQHPWWLPPWVDHPYRLRLPDARWCYVAEPYSLGRGALEDLAYLAANGYEISVTAWKARHYPGHTLAVRLTEEPAP